MRVMDVSREGVVAFAKGSPQDDIQTFHLETGAVSEFLTTPAREYMASFSPDGRWLAYTSNTSGRDEVYVRPFPRSEGIARLEKPVSDRSRLEDLSQSQEITAARATCRIMTSLSSGFRVRHRCLGREMAAAPDGAYGCHDFRASAAARYRSSSSTSVASDTVSAISCRKRSR